MRCKLTSGGVHDASWRVISADLVYDLVHGLLEGGRWLQKALVIEASYSHASLGAVQPHHLVDPTVSEQIRARQHDLQPGNRDLCPGPHILESLTFNNNNNST